MDTHLTTCGKLERPMKKECFLKKAPVKDEKYQLLASKFEQTNQVHGQMSVLNCELNRKQIRMISECTTVWPKVHRLEWRARRVCQAWSIQGHCRDVHNTNFFRVRSQKQITRQAWRHSKEKKDIVDSGGSLHMMKKHPWMTRRKRHFDGQAKSWMLGRLVGLWFPTHRPESTSRSLALLHGCIWCKILRQFSQWRDILMNWFFLFVPTGNSQGIQRREGERIVLAFAVIKQKVAPSIAKEDLEREEEMENTMLDLAKKFRWSTTMTRIFSDAECWRRLWAQSRRRGCFRRKTSLRCNRCGKRHPRKRNHKNGIIGFHPRRNHNVFIQYPTDHNWEVCKKMKETRTWCKMNLKKWVDAIAHRASRRSGTRHLVVWMPSLPPIPVWKSAPVGSFLDTKRKKQCNWWCAAFGGHYIWQAPHRVLVTQHRTDHWEAKVFRAHAAPQGVGDNLINAVWLLTNQQKDGDSPVKRVVLDNQEKKSNNGPLRRFHERQPLSSESWWFRKKHGIEESGEWSRSSRQTFRKQWSRKKLMSWHCEPKKEVCCAP